MAAQGLGRDWNSHTGAWGGVWNGGAKGAQEPVPWSQQQKGGNLKGVASIISIRALLGLNPEKLFFCIFFKML